MRKRSTCLWALLLVPTVGFAYPWRTAALERYKFGHTFYGTLPGGFVATGGQLFKRVWWVWLLGLMPFIGILGGCLAAYRGKAARFHERCQRANDASGLGIVAGVVAFVALPFLHAVRKAMEWRWWAEGIRFGDAAVACDLPAAGLFGVYWGLIGMALLLAFGFGVAAGGIRGLLLLAGHGQSGWVCQVDHRPLCDLVSGDDLVVYCAAPHFHGAPRLAAIIDACSLPVEPGRQGGCVGSAGEAASAVGEGLADGLDFAGF